MIRPEDPTADAAAITQVIERAFAEAEHTSHTEAYIVLGLRDAGVLSVSLVAELAGRVVGHVACSPVMVGDGAHSEGWYGLGPVAVEPAVRSQGIGAALVRAALEQLKLRSAQGCVVLGDPAYYGRFGFKAMPDLVYPGPPSAYFMALPFGTAIPQGVVRYHAAFDSERPGD